MTILDTIFRSLLSQLIFRPRAVGLPAGLRRSRQDIDRRFYAAQANRWGAEADEGTVRSFLAPTPPDRETEEPTEDAASSESRGTRVDLQPALPMPAARGLLACGAADQPTPSFSVRRGR